MFAPCGADRNGEGSEKDGKKIPYRMDAVKKNDTGGSRYVCIVCRVA
jgi:hypothetical protein